MILLQEPEKLFLKRFVPGMICLGRDLVLDRIDIGRTDGKRSVTPLPIEIG
jgi:hypothetical protein